MYVCMDGCMYVCMLGMVWYVCMYGVYVWYVCM